MARQTKPDVCWPLSANSSLYMRLPYRPTWLFGAVALRVTRAYRTVCTAPVLVLARMIPWDLLVED
ncbi:hypothetical protein BIW11_04992 [Tropilaelaps mercedesae]|uniref:Uncharacterized protein n=1 Tax=Tropilaelaps mercedesae TaxID=418985 RepID=A0A1V9WYL3_9ACAR|nr:hypothetical protein BIW11_04992 [Tropilaelaps mercedesae]